MSKPLKTIGDVTNDEWSQLAEAATTLLAAAMFMNWLHPDKEDSSFNDTIEQMRSTLEIIGLPQISIAGFEGNLEEILKSKKVPRNGLPRSKQHKSLIAVTK